MNPGADTRTGSRFEKDLFVRFQRQLSWQVAQALAGESSGAERVTHEGGDSGQVEVKRNQCVRTGGSHAGDRGPGGRVVV